MKVVILAGGYGTRISEETRLKPKPMIEIGDRPILWHIMKIYLAQGFDEFVICLGYKGAVIKRYFAEYQLHHADVTYDFKRSGEMVVHRQQSEPWKVTLVETGKHAMTGARIRRIRPYVGDEPFMLTYGDGLADIDLSALLTLHRERGRFATVTAVRPAARFGVLQLAKGDRVSGFAEKPLGEGGWVNGGFFVLQPQVFDYLGEDDSCVFEQQPLSRLASDGQLTAYRHDGFWQPMDTVRDKTYLDGLWLKSQAPWQLWEEKGR
ncbi:glucose-1-phosphate cytidylyltransferase [Paenibacillus sp. 598K]|uniref:glucose-1-phosphate cytidylyltransferase n=1 Tax=Paenibacillus sp. 598K TaxID=1117987 RepID=UPI000FF93CB2|nr:glucose-1-phosphate cytidylyltransferase [Paenibacillus sp. 598K]GBF72227.1 glucose-1-phosphate cytidylyltransferase [Paenibacillus sp. 598K]